MQLKRWVFLFWLFSCVCVFAQTTSVTATIIDSDSQAWVGMKVTARFVPNPNFPNINQYTVIATGNKISQQIANPDPTIADTTGLFSLTTYDNTAIQPVGSTYTFTLCAKTSAPCSVITGISVFGASEDLSSILNSQIIAPRFAAVSGAYGYNDTEVSPTPLPGGRYFNVISGVTREWNGTTWQTLGPGGGPPCSSNTTVQISHSGTSLDCDPNITINKLTHVQDIASGSGGAYTAPIIGGSYYSTHYGNGTSNGTSSAFTAGAGFVFTDHTYPTTEHYTWSYTNSTTPFSMSQSAVSNWDLRSGKFARTYHNPSQDPFDTSYNAERQNCGYDLTPSAPAGSTNFNCFAQYDFDTAPGIDLGNAPVGQQGWSQQHSIQINKNAISPGISQIFFGNILKPSIGDTDLYEGFCLNYGGAIATSDEGNHCIGVNGGETSTTFAGTVAAGGGGTGATTLKITCTNDCNEPGIGRYLIDTQTTVLTGNVSARTAPSGFTPGTFTIDSSATVSTAWGTLSGNCNAGTGPTPPGTGTNTVTCTVAALSGTFVQSSGTNNSVNQVCFGGQFHEQAVVSSVSGSGPFVLTMNLRHAHESGSWVMQGGLCGTYIDFTINQTTTSQLLRFPIDILGATASNTLVYRWFQQGTGTGFSPGNLIFGTQAATSLTNTGGITTFAAGADDWYVGHTVAFTSAANPAFNGTCTNVFKSLSTSGTTLYNCTQAGLSGQVSATANVAVGTSGLGNTAFTLWSGGEVLDAVNRTFSPPIIDGTLLLEPNSTSWTNGDTVENPHHYTLLADIIQGTTVYNNPSQISNHGIHATCFGPGCSSLGPVSTNSYAMGRFDNAAPTTTYLNHGGYVIPPGGWYLGANGGSGLFNYGLAMQFAPDGPGGGGFIIGAPITGVTDCTVKYPIFQATGSGGNGSIQYTPCVNELAFAGNLLLNTDLPFQQFRDFIRFAALATPVNATFTTSNVGGSLTDSTTYFYRVAATNNQGTSLASTETSITTGTSGGANTNTVTVKWGRVTGAVNYKVYCRTTGAELLCATINGVDILSWIDNGTVTPSGALPATNTSLGGVNSASQLQLQGSTSGTNVTLQAIATQTTSTVKFPQLPLASGNLLGSDGTNFTTVSGTSPITITSSTISCATCTTTPILSATTGSIGGSLLSLGCTSEGTLAVSGATTSQTCTMSGAGGTQPTNLQPNCFVSSANTVTLQFCTAVAITPSAQTYNIRVF